MSSLFSMASILDPRLAKSGLMFLVIWAAVLASPLSRRSESLKKRSACGVAGSWSSMPGEGDAWRWGREGPASDMVYSSKVWPRRDSVDSGEGAWGGCGLPWAT